MHPPPTWRVKPRPSDARTSPRRRHPARSRPKPLRVQHGTSASSRARWRLQRLAGNGLAPLAAASCQDERGRIEGRNRAEPRRVLGGALRQRGGSFWQKSREELLQETREARVPLRCPAIGRSPSTEFQRRASTWPSDEDGRDMPCTATVISSFWLMFAPCPWRPHSSPTPKSVSSPLKA